MSRKNFIIVIIILFVLVVGALVGGYFYLTSTKNTPAPTTISGTGSLNTEDIGTSNTSTSTVQATTTPGVIPRLRQITTTPVAGYDFVDTPQGQVIWYVDRANGNVIQTSTSTLAVTRITNTTIPKVYQAYIGKGGSTVILQMLSDSGESIQTFLASPKTKISTTTSSDNVKDLVGTFLGDNINFLSLAPTKDKLFGILDNGGGSVYTLTGKPTNILSSPLKKWIPQWVNDSTILITSAPAAQTQNLSYFLNSKTGALSKILGPKNGLVALASSDASHVLFSENKADSLSFGSLDVKSGTETVIPQQTIPDKCVWSKINVNLAYCAFPKNIPTALYPDDWYQGKVLFDDTIGSVNTNTFQTDTYSDLQKDSGVQIDATNLVLSKDEKYIMFTNKRDLTLWILQL
jgi:hypothetical protein